MSINVILGIIFSLSTLFFGLHFLKFLNAVYATPRTLVTHGVQDFPAQQYYAFGRIVFSMSLCAVVCFLKPWPVLVTYIIGVYASRAFVELCIALRGKSLLAGSMYFFYERIIHSQLDMLGVGDTFTNLIEEMRQMIAAGEDDELLDKPLIVSLKIYVDNRPHLVRKRAYMAKSSALAYLLAGLVISVYFLGY